MANLLRVLGGCWILVCGLPAAHGLELSGDEPFRDLAQHTLYLEDAASSLTIDDALTARRAGVFQPIDGPFIDFGFSESTYWLAIPVTNTTGHVQDWILSFNMRFMQRLSVYVEQRGVPVLRLYDGEDVPFDARDYSYRHVAMPFRLNPGEQAEIYVAYWSEGTTAIPMSIENTSSMESLKSFHAIKNAAFYSFVAFMFIYSMMFLITVRTAVFRDYAIYLGVVTLYVFHMDGYAFQYVWPDWPAWNAYAALPLGLLLNVGAALFSQTFLQTRVHHPIIHRWLWAIICGAVGLIASSAFLDVSDLKRFAFIYTFACAVCFLTFGLVAYRKRRLGVRFYVVGWLGMTIAALFTTFSHWSSGWLAVGISFELIRVGVFIDATMMALAVLDQYMELRRAQEDAAKREAALLEHKVHLQQRFMDLEHRYNCAHLLASERGVQLATASHDLRQPLAVMRMTIRDLPSDDAQRKRMVQSLTYLERLVERYIDAASADFELPGEAQLIGGSQEPDAEETFPMNVMLDNVKLMFADEAADRGMTLRSVPCGATVQADPLALVRIASNLVSNAIKHSKATTILLGCRRQGSSVRLDVLDNGTGMPCDELERMNDAFARGATEDRNGVGLGMAIVAELCDSHGYNLEAHSRVGQGTRVGVTIARAVA